MALKPETRDKLMGVSTATLCTALFKRGLRNQFVQDVRPLKFKGRNMVGEAFTLRYNLAQVFIQLGDKVEARRQLLELAKAIQASGNQRYAFLLERTVATLQALERGQL